MSADHHDEWLLGILGSLERPAMPQEVADRLDTALAAIPVQRDGAHDGPVGAEPGVLPPPQRRRRRSWVAGGATAAVALLVALSPALVTGGAPEPTAPQASAPASSAPLAAQVPDEQPAVVPPPAPLGPQIMVASQTSYTRQALSQQTVEVVESAVEEQPAPTPSAMALPDTWRAAAEQPAASRAGAAACISGLPEAELPVLFVDRADFEGEPALVVARRAGPQIEVHVLRASCTSEDPSILLRATVEAP